MLVKFKKCEGFTLVEILVVVVIIAILAAIAVPIYLNYVEQARATEAKEAIGAVWGAAKVHYARTGAWPTNIDQMRHLELDQITLDRWNFNIVAGGQGINRIIATSTGLMPGGAGKQVILEARTGKWRGYGED